MANGIYVATSSSISQLRHLEVLSHNLAHANTAGFKADRVSYRETAAKIDSAAAQADPTKGDKRYTDTMQTNARLAPGELIRTDNPLDLALTGNAFLRVQTPQGERLTRNGRLMLGADGTLKTLQGHAVLDSGGRPMRLNVQRAPVIDASGRIAVDGKSLGQLGVTAVDLKVGLHKDSQGLFIPPEETSTLDGNSQVQQGFLEDSNVSPIQLMVELIEVQRTFSALQQAITTHGELDSRAARLAQ
ncbi:MAG: flagellar basal-body rod protein FlgF [Myxococcota bacterium]|jgi:flagellar basal-body rod protein FlgF